MVWLSLPWELDLPQDGGEGCHTGPLAIPAGDRAEEGLVPAGLQAELVQRVGSGVGEIVSLLGLLAQDALASACPRCERTARCSSADSPFIQPRGYRAALGSGTELGCAS